MADVLSTARAKPSRRGTRQGFLGGDYGSLKPLRDKDDTVNGHDAENSH